VRLSVTHPERRFAGERFRSPAPTKEEDVMVKAAVWLGAALIAFWLMGSTWQQDRGGGPITQGGCLIDPDGRPFCQP